MHAIYFLVLTSLSHQHRHSHYELTNWTNSSQEPRVLMQPMQTCSTGPPRQVLAKYWFWTQEATVLTIAAPYVLLVMHHQLPGSLPSSFLPSFFWGYFEQCFVGDCWRSFFFMLCSIIWFYFTLKFILVLSTMIWIIPS